MRTRFALVALIAVMILSTPCYALTCHDLAMSYIEHDQDPQRLGDTIKTGAQNEPILMETTAYYQGTHGSHGDRMREGYCAGDPDLYGAVITLYEAIPQDNGTYRIGEALGIYECRDCGYGYPLTCVSANSEAVKQLDHSITRQDRSVPGSIESGVHIDIFRNSYQGCVEWMKRTHGKVFAVISEGKG